MRKIFDLYLEHGSLLPVVKEVEARGWLGLQPEIVVKIDREATLPRKTAE